MIKGLLAMMAASLTLWGVDMRLQRADVLRKQARTESHIRRLDGELRRIRSDAQEALAEPQLLLALEDMGYHRFYRDTRQLARRLLRGEDGSRLAEENSNDGPNW